jgi:inner membrane protein
MPTVMTHAVVGVALGTLVSFPARCRLFWILSATLPVLPDLDVLGLALGIRFHSMWGHRGISHSLAAALVIGLLTALVVYRRLGMRLASLTLYFALITASHGVLDAFTSGGPGVAFWAPFDDTRYFFPWRPIPVSPLAPQFFSEWGWHAFKTELLLIWLPSAIVAAAGIVRRRRSSGRRTA